MNHWLHSNGFHCPDISEANQDKHFNCNSENACSNVMWQPTSYHKIIERVVTSFMNGPLHISLLSILIQFKEWWSNSRINSNSNSNSNSNINNNSNSDNNSRLQLRSDNLSKRESPFQTICSSCIQWLLLSDCNRTEMQVLIIWPYLPTLWIFSHLYSFPSSFLFIFVTYL